jgi:hypothetical protein
MAGVLIASFSYEGVIVKIYAEQVGSDVKLTIDSTGSTATFDLNGLFIDYGNDGGSMTSVGSKANNMNGADSQDGTKFDGFDAGYVLGSIGGNDANVMSTQVTLAGKTLADLQGAEIGLRMQGVSTLDGGSLKLGEVANIPSGGNGANTNDFPVVDNISFVDFYFDKDGDGDADAVVRVNYSGPATLPNMDVDNWDQKFLDAIKNINLDTADTATNDLASYTYMGAAIHVGGPTGGTLTYYSLDNDTTPETAPAPGLVGPEDGSGPYGFGKDADFKTLPHAVLSTTDATTFAVTEYWAGNF